MSRLVKIAALLLLAVWLPATLHCRIEAAGFGAPHHEGCAAEHDRDVDTDCRDDVCPTVEETLFKESTVPLHVPGAAGHEDVPNLLIVRAKPPGFAPLAPRRRAPPPGLLATWRFDFRAAPPARAPSRHS